MTLYPTGFLEYPLEFGEGSRNCPAWSYKSVVTCREWTLHKAGSSPVGIMKNVLLNMVFECFLSS